MAPWQSPAEWREVDLFFRSVSQKNPEAMAALDAPSREIQTLYSSVSDPMEALCSRVCPGCTDVCCHRAVIWYDFKDLVCHFAAFGRLPDSQVRKRRDRHGRSACSLLGPSGCRLPRAGRPFVCTWYLCPALKRAAAEADVRRIQTAIDRIKQLRLDMETAFCRM